MTPTTSSIASSSVPCTSATDARIVCVRSAAMSSVRPGGNARVSSGSSSRTALTVSTMFAPGWRCTSSSTAGRPLNQAADAVVFHAVGDGADIGQPHGRAGAPDQDQVAIGVGGDQLVVGADRE